MHRGHHHDVARIGHVLQDRAFRKDLGHGQFGILLGHLLHQRLVLRGAIGRAARRDGRFDPLQHMRQIAQLDLVDGALGRAGGAVPSTTMALEPETLQANSRLPMMSVFT
ncbi:hypothetical protein [Paracoccus sp. AS002]|uniref:hypothetical protein n=1 Tax=Paracoccus sp. AS002 TaxID=3019545 RepID=UPI0023E83B37|nr:hypothetical protein [Paracoccus sp. AS002]MDF3905910.1 hypothetical protein [Paracoccus sp. AS002]